MIDVYLVPAGPDRHELYCEAASQDHNPGGDEPASSLWARLKAGFRRAIDEGEAHRNGEISDQGHSRVRRAITRKLAEAVAEQRLLWNLRGETEARLFHPDDMPAEDAVATCLRLITADRDKHRRRCIIDGVLLVLSAPIALVPGPNLLAYYFTFGTVGHFLSMKGAEQGRSRVAWKPSPCRPLMELRAALLDKVGCRSKVEAIARELQLERLPQFIDRVADHAS
jgi:hypothetical protein